MAAAASNSRPTEVVDGEFTPASQAARNKGPPRSSPPGQALPHSQHRARAERHGSRAALSPPGRRNGRMLATRVQEPGAPNSASPPQRESSGPRPTPSQVKHNNGAPLGYS